MIHINRGKEKMFNFNLLPTKSTVNPFLPKKNKHSLRKPCRRLVKVREILKEMFYVDARPFKTTNDVLKLEVQIF